MNKKTNKIFNFKFLKIGISTILILIGGFFLLFFLEFSSKKDMHLKNSKIQAAIFQKSILYQISYLAEWLNYYRHSPAFYSVYDGNEIGKNFVSNSLKGWVDNSKVLIAAIVLDADGKAVLGHSKGYSRKQEKQFKLIKDSVIKSIQKDEFHLISKLNEEKDNTYFIHFTTIYDGDIKKGYLVIVSDMKKMIIHYKKYYRNQNYDKKISFENNIGFSRIKDDNIAEGILLNENSETFQSYNYTFRRADDYLITADKNYIIPSENPTDILQKSKSLEKYKVKFTDNNREAVPIIFINKKTIDLILKEVGLKYINFFILTALITLALLYKYLKITFEKDLSERRLKVQRNKLNKKIASINTVVSVVGHDIKGPFTSLLGGLSIINKKIHTIPEEKLVTYLKCMEEECKKACYISDNLMKWAISQNGFSSCRPDNLEVLEIVKDQINEYSEMAKLKEIQIKTDIPQGLMCYSDRDILKTIIRNLFINSIKFTSFKGTITIKTIERDHQIELITEDTGIGISQNVLEMIERDTFYSSSGTTGEVGNGMGLILTKRLCSINNGTFKIYSQVNKGTSFVVTIPKKSFKTRI